MSEAGKFAGSRDGNDTAAIQKHDAGGQQKGFANVVGDQYDGVRHVGGQPEELALEFGAGDRIEGPEGFVHQKDLWIRSEGTGYADPLALATGKLARIAIGIDRRRQADRLQDFDVAGRDAIRGPIFELGHEANVFTHG